MADDAGEAGGRKHPGGEEQPDGSPYEDQATEEEHLQRPRHRTLLSVADSASIDRVLELFLRPRRLPRFVRKG
jgi:hypothetical protein